MLNNEKRSTEYLRNLSAFLFLVNDNSPSLRHVYRPLLFRFRPQEEVHEDFETPHVLINTFCVVMKMQFVHKEIDYFNHAQNNCNGKGSDNDDDKLAISRRRCNTNKGISILWQMNIKTKDNRKSRRPLAARQPPPDQGLCGIYHRRLA